jgi:hypothetical protein
MATGRRKETVDIYSVLKPFMFVSRVLGLAPYSVVSDMGRRKFAVSPPAVVYSVAMFIINAGAVGYCQYLNLNSWNNICNSAENILDLAILCTALTAYYTTVINRKQTATQLSCLNDLIAETHYSAWKKEVQTILITQVFGGTLLVVSAVMETSNLIHTFDDISFVSYFIAGFATLISEYQFVAVMIVLKRVFQNCNAHIGAVGEMDDVTTGPNVREKINMTAAPAGSTFRVSDRPHNQSRLMRFKYLRELHISAREVAESVNSIFSLFLLLSTATMFITLTQSVYYIFIDFIVQKRSFLCNTTSNKAYFTCLLYHALKLISLIYFSSFAAEEVSQHAHCSGT